MWDLPKPVSPALAGRFPTTGIISHKAFFSFFFCFIFLPSHICKLPLRSLPHLSLLNYLSIQNYLWSKKEYFPLTKYFSKYLAPLVAQTVKNLPAVQETWVRSLGQEDPLEKGMATHSHSCLEIPWTEEPGRL